jgi:histidine triad (HIT) family protein
MEKGCIFCQIIAGEREADFVHRDDDVVVFKDIRPHAPVHLLIVPTKHIRSINDLSETDGSIIGSMTLRARAAAQEAGIDQSGYRLVVNVERGGGQLVFHVHMHLIGGWKMEDHAPF